MCGRFTLRATPAELQEAFHLLRQLELRPNYNVAPTQSIPVIRETEGHREAALMSWGLVPSWAKERKIGNNLINARADGIDSKPSFRAAFKRKRCLIPADGFYEWKVLGPKEKQPYFIHRRDNKPFAFAGLWEFWKSPEGEELESACLITTTPNGVMEPIHNRMPVILAPEMYDVWMNTPEGEAKSLLGLLVPCPDDWLVAEAVSKLVNKPANNVPQCVVPI
ncbi:MAG: SOS response-associated peptidase [Planctomycetales bacterium]